MALAKGLVLKKDPKLTARCYVTVMYVQPRVVPPTPTKLVFFDCDVSPKTFKPGDTITISFRWRVEPSGASAPRGSKLHIIAALWVWYPLRRTWMKAKMLDKTYDVGGRSSGYIEEDVSVPDLDLPPGSYHARVYIYGELSW